MTYLEKAKLEQPDRFSAFSVADIEAGAIGCPHSWGFESDLTRCPSISCKECWNQEVPETKENEKEIITMKDILEILRTSVADCVSYDDIKAAVVSYIEDHDFSCEVDSLVEDAVSEHIGDYISDALADIIKDEVRCTLEDMFN